MRRWPQYLLVMTGTSLAVLAAIAAINLRVSNDGVYDFYGHGVRVNDYVRQLIASPYGLAQLPLDRPVKLELAKVVQPDCAVIGSSRVMAISPETMPLFAHCKHFANLGVSGNSFEDSVSMLGALADDKRLRHIYIGIDPWLRTNADQRWQSLKPAYLAARARFGLPKTTAAEWPGQWERFWAVFDGHMLLHNLTYRAPPTLYEPVAKDLHNIPLDQAVMLSDGTFIYSRKHTHDNPPGPVPPQPHLYKIEKPYFEPNYGKELLQVLRYFQRRGVEIHLILTPYHPYMTECHEQEFCEAARLTKNYAMSIAPCLKAEIIGDYDANKFGLTWHDFYDAVHMAISAFPNITAERPDPAGCRISE